MPKTKKRGREWVFGSKNVTRRAIQVRRETHEKITLLASAAGIPTAKMADDILSNFAKSEEARELVAKAVA